MMPIIADVVAGPAIVVFGLGIGLALLFGIIVLEAIVLRVLKWGTFWRAVRDSLIVNAASGLVGIVLILPFGDTFDRCAFGITESPLCWLLLSPAAVILGAWMLSVLIEGAIMMWLRTVPVRQTVVAAVLMNIASYVLVVGLFLLSAN
jgi:hypothetical protein